MGIRDLHHWNKACSLRLLWLLFFRAGSIWVAWVVKNILQNDKSKLWIIKEKQSYSHSIKKILRVRDLAYNWIKVEVGNGRDTRFWTDNWSPLGNLTTFLNLRSSTLGTRQSSTISELCNNGAWSLPSPRSEAQLALHTHLTTVNLSEADDTTVWSPLGKRSEKFSTGMIYNLIREHKPVVAWNRAVWSSRGIPKHNFLSWLVTLNRCPTKDRLLGWGLQVNPLCVLCNAAPETRDHLYFDCAFSFSVWSPLARKSKSPATRSWNQLLTCMQSLTSPKHNRLLSLLTWKATIYSLWMEWNSRIHRNHYRGADSLISSTSALIKNKISSFRESSPTLTTLMMQSWLED